MSHVPARVRPSLGAHPIVVTAGPAQASRRPLKLGDQLALDPITSAWIEAMVPVLELLGA